MSHGRHSRGSGRAGGLRNSNSSSWKKSWRSTSHQQVEAARGRPWTLEVRGPANRLVPPAGRKPSTSRYQAWVRRRSTTLNATWHRDGCEATALTSASVPVSAAPCVIWVDDRGGAIPRTGTYDQAPGRAHGRLARGSRGPHPGGVLARLTPRPGRPLARAGRRVAAPHRLQPRARRAAPATAARARRAGGIGGGGTRGRRRRGARGPGRPRSALAARAAARPAAFPGGGVAFGDRRRARHL